MFSTAKYAYHIWRYGQSKAVVSLRSAKAPNPADHAAVWLGVNDKDQWIQGGVEYTNGDTFPRVYVEANGPHTMYRFRSKKVAWGQTVTVRLFFRAGRWYVGIDKELNPGWSVGLPKNTKSQSLVETYGDAVCTATIDGNLIRSV